MLILLLYTHTIHYLQGHCSNPGSCEGSRLIYIVFVHYYWYQFCEVKENDQVLEATFEEYHQDRRGNE
eukprot:4533400-Ditylum_brightwellii.AAC.1